MVSSCSEFNGNYPWKAPGPEYGKNQKTMIFDLM